MKMLLRRLALGTVPFLIVLTAGCGAKAPPPPANVPSAASVAAQPNRVITHPALVPPPAPGVPPGKTADGGVMPPNMRRLQGQKPH